MQIRRAVACTLLVLLVAGPVAVACSNKGDSVAVIGDSITALDQSAMNEQLGGTYEFVVTGNFGKTVAEVMPAVAVTEPDYGTLLDDMFFPEGSDIPTDRFIAPRVEVELAFILGRRLQGPNVSIFDVLAATDYVVPAIEIIDARIEQFDRHTKVMRKVFDTIADNAANAGIITGGRPVKPDAVDLRWVSALLYKNGVIEESGVAAAVLNHPAQGVAWLANKLAPWGEYLEAGEVVLGGSFTRPTGAVRGDTFHADYGPLGSISLRFV